MVPKKLLVSNLTKTFSDGTKSIPTLSSISLTLEKGEFVSIIGPSGCGKSTFFKILAGIEQETSGSIFLDGKESAKRKGQFGYMPQKPLLLPWRNVLENCMLGFSVKGSVQEDAKQKALVLLKRFGLVEFADAYPKTLSGGMEQRVALLRTILYNRSFLLLDEPFGALDALTRVSLQLWLHDVWREFESSVLFVTHDIREALFLSDRIYVFSHRPASIRKEIHVPLPRPRKRLHLKTKVALELEEELEELLRREETA